LLGNGDIMWKYTCTITLSDLASSSQETKLLGLTFVSVLRSDLLTWTIQ